MSSVENNFGRALSNLERSLSTPVLEPRDLSGIIKDFEMCYELSWKWLKKLLRAQGVETLGPKDAFSKAYQLGLMNEETIWLNMFEDRNLMSHVYDESEAKKIVDSIRADYFAAFVTLKKLTSQETHC